MFTPLLCEPIWELNWKLVKVCEYVYFSVWIRHNFFRRRSTSCSSRTIKHILYTMCIACVTARLRTVKSHGKTLESIYSMTFVFFSVTVILRWLLFSMLYVSFLRWSYGRKLIDVLLSHISNATLTYLKMRK